MNKALLSLLFFSISAAASNEVCSRTGFLLALFHEDGAKYYQTQSGEVIHGTFSEIQLTPDYRIRVYETPGGNVHLFDSDHSFPRVVRDAEEDVVMKSTDNYKTIMEVDRKKAKQLICSQYGKLMNNDEFRYIKSSLERSLSKSNPPLKSIQCFKSAGTFTAAFMAYYGTNGGRSLGMKNWLTEHGDNFYLTIPLMRAFNRCVYSSFGSTVALGAGLNIVEEANIGSFALSPVSRTRERKRTDWKDLKAGMSAVGAYAAWAVLSEKYFNFRFDRVCR